MPQAEPPAPVAPAAPVDPALRAQAERRARDLAPHAAVTLADSQRLIHELRVHQIELELQNEELRRTQIALEASRERYFTLYDLAPIGYLTLTPGGAIVEANLAAARLLGCVRRDLIGRPLSRAILADDQDLYYHCRQAVTAEAPARDCELRVQSADQSARWIRLSLAWQPALDGAAEVLAVLTDTDAHHQIEAKRSAKTQALRRDNARLEQCVRTGSARLDRAEADLHGSEERLRYALEAAQDGIWDWNLETGTVFYSPAYARMLGYEPEELSPDLNAWIGLLPPEQREDIRATAWEQLQQGAAQLEYRLRTKSGEDCWVLSRARVVARDHAGAPARVVGTHVDITARKHAEQLLERYRQVVDTASDLLFFLDADLRFAMTNPAFADFVQRTPEQLLGQSVAEVTPPAVYAQVAPHLSASLAGEQRHFRFEEPDPSGHIRSFEAEHHPLTVAGAVVGIAVSLHDVTLACEAQAALEAERTQLETQVVERTADLRLQTERLRLAAEAGGIGFWQWNPDTGEIVWDGQVRRLYGLDEGTPLPGYRAWLSLLHPEDIPRIQAQARRVLDGTADLFDDVFRVRGPDGRERRLASRGRLLSGHPNASADPLVIGVNRDVTAEVERAAQLQASEARARAIVATSPVPLAIVTADGVPEYLNPAFVEAFGYTREDIPTWADWWSRSSVPGNNGNPAATSGTQQAEIRLLAKDGRQHIARVQAQTLAENKQLYTFVDITELKDAREAAERAAQVKADFLAQMSHEIRTPLNAALGMTQVLQSTPLDAHQHRLVHQIRAAGQALLEILNDILDLSKIEADQLQLDEQIFTLPEILAFMESLFGVTAHDKGLRLAISPPPAIDGALLGDPRRLRQVLINLIGNAIKFTEQGEVAVHTLLASSTADQARLRFEILDTGAGIDADTIEQLFTPFFQGHTVAKRQVAGTGLGLAICQRLISAMGGQIGVESLPGAGSLFWFEVPFARTDQLSERPACPAPAASLPAGTRLAGLHVLLVDDSEMNRAVGESLLAVEGARTTLAADGEQAVELLRERPRDFDAVLMDVQMRNLDGLAATRLIRHELGLADLPIIAVTAAVLPEQLDEARAAGMNGVLTKPVDLEGLTAQLRACVPALGGAAAPAPTTAAEPPAGGADDASQSPPFPHIAGIDRARAMQAFPNHRDLFMELLFRFMDACTSVVADTREALASDDRDRATRLLHGLRGNAGIVAALPIATACRALEEAIDADRRDLDEPLQALAGQLEAMVAAIAPWRSADADRTAAPDPDPNPLSPAVPDPVSHLREALQLNDLEALAGFERLQSALSAHLGAARTRALGEAIRALRFDHALALLNEPPPSDADSASEPVGCDDDRNRIV